MKGLSFNGKRFGIGILLLIALFSVTNYYLQWQLFGQFNKVVMIGIFVVMYIYLRFVGPTLEEVRDYRDQKRRERGLVRVGFQPRVYFLTFLVVMIVFALIGPVFRLIQGEPVQREDWVDLIIVEALIVIAAIVGWYPAKRLFTNRE
ncbi:MAG TPA: hypothetical protein QF499_10035 [Gammaproteobacteria bacterium]|jgi:hypothetical protein|nr:hypothetical protein [Gammaproteobacteria bacterium]MDP7296155.1 hypothetical protein [Gammaproteobacteria bacterium]MDP7660054.1 hypothetical protein [Gammaproteobacteria bacterium]HJP39448.1 hypothetical protein [Gammaproteobacteria bacterium]